MVEEPQLSRVGDPALASVDRPDRKDVSVDLTSGATRTAEPSTTTPDRAGSTTDTAKAEAAGVAREAGETGQHVASVAADEASSLVSEAGDRAQDLLAQARSTLMEQTSTQQNALASMLRTVADDLHAMVERGDSDRADSDASEDAPAGAGVARQTVGEVSSRAADAASWLDAHDPSEVLDEVSRFARRRPGAFLLVAGVAGVVAGRLTRGLSGGEPDTSPRTAPSASRPARGVADPDIPADLAPLTTRSGVDG